MKNLKNAKKKHHKIIKKLQKKYALKIRNVKIN